jgi:hypothetical protein
MCTGGCALQEQPALGEAIVHFQVNRLDVFLAGSRSCWHFILVVLGSFLRLGLHAAAGSTSPSRLPLRAVEIRRTLFASGQSCHNKRGMTH